MKSICLNLLSFVFLACATGFAPAAAQSLASAQVGATIVTPVTMAKENDLAFEKVAVRQSAGASAMKEMIAAGSATAASFTVSGSADYAYGLTMPEKFSMAVGGLTVTIGTTVRTASADYTLSRNGTDAIAIAGSLSLGASAPDLAMNAIHRADADHYDHDADFERERGGFPVTIIYN